MGQGDGKVLVGRNKDPVKIEGGRDSRDTFIKVGPVIPSEWLQIDFSGRSRDDPGLVVFDPLITGDFSIISTPRDSLCWL